MKNILKRKEIWVYQGLNRKGTYKRAGIERSFTGIEEGVHERSYDLFIRFY